jgi:hypothetical protein
MLLVRRIGAVVLAVAAIVIWVIMAPDDSSGSSSDVRRALAEYELNEARTEGAPQQQVVNGWVAKDLLAIIAEQQDQAVSDERLPALAVLIVFGLALHIATTPRTAEPGGPLSVPVPQSPDPSALH